jgi:hypothetical protein
MDLAAKVDGAGLGQKTKGDGRHAPPFFVG